MSSKIDYNYCNYSTGNKHSCCEHPYYCIFNPQRIQLEKSILALEKELHYRIKSLEFIKGEGTSNSADYEQTKRRIKILNNDLNNLRKFQNKIIEKEDEKYGFIQI